MHQLLHLNPHVCSPALYRKYLIAIVGCCNTCNLPSRNGFDTFSLQYSDRETWVSEAQFQILEKRSQWAQCVRL